MPLTALINFQRRFVTLGASSVELKNFLLTTTRSGHCAKKKIPKQTSVPRSALKNSHDSQIIASFTSSCHPPDQEFHLNFIHCRRHVCKTAAGLRFGPCGQGKHFLNWPCPICCFFTCHNLEEAKKKSFSNQKISPVVKWILSAIWWAELYSSLCGPVRVSMRTIDQSNMRQHKRKEKLTDLTCVDRSSSIHLTLVGRALTWSISRRMQRFPCQK